MPVISRLGSTSLSVIRMSPSFFIHSMALRKSRTSSGEAPSLLVAVAIAPPPVELTNNYSSLFRLSRSRPRMSKNLRVQLRKILWEILEPGRLNGIYAYTTPVEKSTQRRACGSRVPLPFKVQVQGRIRFCWQRVPDVEL